MKKGFANSSDTTRKRKGFGESRDWPNPKETFPEVLSGGWNEVTLELRRAGESGGGGNIVKEQDGVISKPNKQSHATKCSSSRLR